MTHIKLELPSKYIEEIPQRVMISKSIEDRQNFFLHPPYVYTETTMADESPSEPICWSIADPLYSWLRSYGLTHRDVMLSIAARSQGVDMVEGWRIWLPAHIATLYKLTWL